MNKNSILAILLILPHCGGSIQKAKTFQPVKEQSKQRIGIEPDWHFKLDRLHVEKMIKEGITIEQAIAVGIENNEHLQAQFESLGIKKADLVQAGFYSNPHVETIFKIPTKSDIRTNIEFSASFRLSDLWQVPLRKKVAQDELEIKTYEILKDILILRHHIQQSFYTISYNLKMLNQIKKITNVVKELKERIDYRYQFGYQNDMDRYYAESKVAEWEAKTIQAEADLLQSYVTLHELLGSYVTMHPIKLIDTHKIDAISFTVEHLEKFALMYHPLVLIEQSKIARATHAIRYEESRIFDNVQLGINYERDFEDNTAGVGPALGIDIPIFNTNYGNIERARFEHTQAEKTLIVAQRHIHENVIKQFTQYNFYLKQIQYYEQQVLPPAIKAIEYSQKYFDRMQMDMIVFLNTQISFYEYKMKLLTLAYHAVQEFSNLEFTIGAQMSNVEIT